MTATPDQPDRLDQLAEHHHPTNWRGRGCPDCAAEHSLTRAQRRQARRHPEDNR